MTLPPARGTCHLGCVCVCFFSGKGYFCGVGGLEAVFPECGWLFFSGFQNWFCFGVYSFTVYVCEGIPLNLFVFVGHHKQCCRNVLLKHNLLLGHRRLVCLNPWLRGSCIRESVVTEEKCRRNRLKSSRKAFSSE